MPNPTSDSLSESTAKRLSRFPVWAPLLVMIAVLLTGLVLAWGSGDLPDGYYILFAVSIVVCTLLVDPRGLFLTVASFPLWFFFSTILIGMIAGSSGSTGYSMKTRVATAVYPAVENFLWLGVPFLICLILAIVRWWLFRDRFERSQIHDRQQRQRNSIAERTNQRLSQQARLRSPAPSRQPYEEYDPYDTQDDYAHHDYDDHYARPAAPEPRQHPRIADDYGLHERSDRRQQVGLDDPLLTPEESTLNAPRPEGSARREQSPIPPTAGVNRRWNSPRHYLED